MAGSPAAQVFAARRRWPVVLGLLVALLLVGLLVARPLLLIVVAHQRFTAPVLVFPEKSPGDEFRQVASVLANSENEYFGQLQTRRLESQLKQGGLSQGERSELERQVAFDQIRRGTVERAQRSIEQALADAAPLPENISLQQQLRFTSSLVFLRTAEQQNCVGRHCAQSCIFPIERGGVHQRRQAAERARAELEDYLSLDPAAPQGMAWLLNVVNMTLGEYPEGVPERFRLDPARFAAQGDCPRFTDVARELGIGRLARAGSAAIDDFDGDGRLDLLAVSAGFDESAALYRNPGTGVLEEAADAGLADQRGGLHCVPADYDNDGDADLLILRGAWLMHQGRIRNSLLRNDGGRFTDVTRQAGLAEPAYPSQVGVWGDFDNDGDVDLFVGNESLIELTRIVAEHDPLLGRLSDSALARLLPDGRYPSQYYRNNGDGTFTEMARAVGLENVFWCKGAAAGDYDNDGDLDLYVSNFAVKDRAYGRNRLFQNQGDGTFRDVAAQAGVADPPMSFACWFFDYDNDGWLDLWVNSNVGKLEAYAAGYQGPVPRDDCPRVFHNEQGRFRDATAALGVEHPYLVMGASFGDLDHDGWLDVYLGTGAPPFETLVPNVMLKNHEGRLFQDVTTAGGFGHLQKGHGIVLADLDSDGDEDVYADLGGFFPADRFTKALFLNPGSQAHYLYLELVGTLSNRRAVGARVKVTLDTPRGQREIHRAVGSVSSFGGHPRRLEIGLGDAERIAQLEIDWPRSGIHQVFVDVPLDAHLEVVEESGHFAVLPLEPIDFSQHIPAAEQVEETPAVPEPPASAGP